ncbi:MAG: tRNA(Glu)-specific nuclease WapA [Verrucomicrobiae bacterium]|nr:tRNA(Glu)-specific nuclease WapA [Verrucomicrobiae bacterium]
MNRNRTNITTLEGVNSYSYNSNNWLVAVTYPDSRTQEFTYDPVGNRVQLADSGIGVSLVTYSYDAANRMQTDIAGTTTNAYTFDGAGRLTNQVVSGSSRAYAYDFRSQTTALTDTNAATGAYAFDSDGNRIVETAILGGSFRYVYDGPNVVLELTNSLVQAVYVHSLGIDQPIERIQFISGVSDGRHVYHTDILGSVWAMTDDLQAVAKSYTYEAFGKIRSESGTGLLFPNRYTYTARESMGDSAGLYYYRWRVMDPSVGRFTSEDPLGNLDGLSLYIYVRNGATAYVDPDGRVPVFPCLVCGACGAAAFLDCAGICGCSFWSDPDETFPQCMKACIEAAADAGWITIGCAAACVACPFF